MWQIRLLPCCWSRSLSAGDHNFELVFGAIGSTGDYTVPILGVEKGALEAVRPGEESQQHIAPR